MARKPSQPPIIDAVRCKGCELCVAVCPHGVLKMTESLNERGQRVVEIVAADRCNLCGRCILICPDLAITEPCPLNPEPCPLNPEP